MTDRLGTIERCYTVRFERESKHSAARLWKALTDADEVSAWMDYPASIDLRPGGRWYVDFSKTDEGDLDGIVVRAEPERLLTYLWGLSVCEWTIAPATAGCTYTFVQAGLALRDIDDEEGLAAGWHVFFDQLDLHLDGQPIIRADQMAKWNELKPPYRERLDAALR